jgi:hypothetical protein
VNPAYEKHHWVPKSYLKFWTKNIDAEAPLRVFLVNEQKEIKVSPTAIGSERGLYDLGRVPANFSYLPREFLEKDIFATQTEPIYPRLAGNFFSPFIATRQEIEGMAFYAMTLFFRNPSSMLMRERAVSQMELDAEGKEFMGNRALLTLATVLRGAPKALESCLLHLFTASGHASFITSDNPCSFWLLKDGISHPVTSIEEVHEAGGQGAATRWAFPVTPRCLMVISTLDRPGVEVMRAEASDAEISEYNRMIKKVAHRFIVLPP